MKCPFCYPYVSDVVFVQSENFKALYNIAPIFPGHSLIVPDRHIASILDLGDKELFELILFSRRVTSVLIKVFGADGFNWSLQDKKSAGQTISHLHMHIVPRIKGDSNNPGNWYPKIESNYQEILDSDKRKKLKPEEMKQIISKLRDAFNREDEK